MREAVRELSTVGADAPTRVPLGGLGDLTGGRSGRPRPPRARCSTCVEVRAGQLGRCKPRSASLHNLHLFPPVFTGDILTDFPFIEASFGGSARRGGD